MRDDALPFWLDVLGSIEKGVIVGAALAFLYILARNSQTLVVLARDVRQTLVVRDAKRYGQSVGGEHAQS